MEEGIGVQTIEDFWGAELSSKKKAVTWQTDDDDDDDEMNGVFSERTLELRQACLGATAKEGERNIVQVTAENEEGETVKHTILSLRVAGTEQCSLFLTLHPPVTFELVSGSGPVHIVGSSVESLQPLDDLDSSSDEEDDFEVSSPELRALVNSAKKRPATSPAIRPSKQMKLDKSSSDSAGENTLNSSMSTNRSKEEEESDEDEDEEEEDSEDEDEDMSEDEEDSEEEEEEEEIKPPTKKPKASVKPNGKPKQKIDIKSKLFKTPQPTKQTNKPTKGTVSAPTTPKQYEKKGGVKGGVSLDEAKKKLLKQLPNVPKKLEKFNNYVGNSFKIKDDTVKKQLWEFVQKNRPEK